MPNCKISRFVFTNAWMRANGSVKWNAFMPSEKNPRPSVFRIDGLTEEDVWNIGVNVAGKPSGRDLKGRADLFEQDVINVRLHLENTPEPPRHAEIVGWSPDKADNMSKAQELAHISKGYYFLK